MVDILNKRDNYRRAFARFDPAKLTRFGCARRKRLMADPGIVRKPPQDRIGDRKRPGLPRSAAGIRLVRRLSVELVDGRPLQNSGAA